MVYMCFSILLLLWSFITPMDIPSHPFFIDVSLQCYFLSLHVVDLSFNLWLAFFFFYIFSEVFRVKHYIVLRGFQIFGYTSKH